MESRITNSDPTLDTLRHRLKNRPLLLLFTKAGGFALAPQDVKEERGREAGKLQGELLGPAFREETLTSLP